MNKIVREHYPVEKLPEDLRAELGLAQTVTVVIEAETPPRQNDTGDPYHAPSCHWRPQKALPRRLPASIMPAGEAGKSVVDRQPSSLLSFLKIIFGFILCSQSLPDAALERLQAS